MHNETQASSPRRSYAGSTTRLRTTGQLFGLAQDVWFVSSETGETAVVWLNSGYVSLQLITSRYCESPVD